MHQLYTDWEALENDIRNCTKCPLHKSRKNAVPGEGPRDAVIMMIGEAPGATEDEMGRPFVGAAGRLLTTVLESTGIKRSEVYITNVVKCRPPNNREPLENEIAACSPYLESQIALIKPKIIVTLGNVAGKWVFEKSGVKWLGVTKMRGKTYRLKLLGMEVVVVPTIHPAAALYNPGLRNVFMSDIKLVKEVLDSILRGETITAEQPQPKLESGSRARTLLDYVKK